MQYLYQWSINPGEILARELDVFFREQEHPREYFAFAEELIVGALSHMDEIDGIIREYLQNWEFNRIARVDLAILRLAIHEMLRRNDIPPIVSINEAIDLSKVYSNADSRRFINGILDQFKLKLGRPLRTPSV